MGPSRLCTECGTCYGICPKNNILVEIDEIGRHTFRAKDLKLCVGCSLCYDVCPGFEVDFNELNTEVFSKPVSSDLLSGFIGHFVDIYRGHATDDQIRLNAASGGITSALLCYALETGRIDGVYVVKMKD
ncbi:MAG: coenzyme F420 hydrogenase/dehydrogenase beta subunit N-terminal domain-containing protein, partial [Candidatus Hodarchaeota archaeon]